jgi:hypothetical protein
MTEESGIIRVNIDSYQAMLVRRVNDIEHSRIEQLLVEAMRQVALSRLVEKIPQNPRN